MYDLIEKFLNENFIVTHFKSKMIHRVTSYNRKKCKIITTYETNDERYAHLRFIQSVHNFMN